MKSANTSTNVNTLPNELKTVKELIYDNHGLNLTNLKFSTESLEYGACSFELNNKKIQYRVAKITPLKSGHFVTIWQRNKNGITEPFHISDDLDFIIIAAKRGNNFGQFIFPKFVLAEKGIITNNNKEGKRGIRVYPPWDTVASKQAEKTQTWQTKYFFTIDDGNSSNKDLIRRLLF
ncbi:hypothetical protein GCM10011387_32180 [Pedobacter quisquiliarum]|uniref:MepB protein n=1 Tax=Pedobacter quisquiliarum TaxID=1834438 RepID=A0A916UK65_9SPHI|nr:MepB family protein [Pedobacter quisquiliarum]GGC75946.1 hypothetical protein GCM10011387_32180 [Pedobacter quisquiliarum]